MTAGQVLIQSFESQLLKNNPLNDPHIRKLAIYLPPGYESSTQTYPVVFLLPAFSGKGLMMLNVEGFGESMDERLNRLIGSGEIKPMIAVMPDCFTYYGGSQYLDSSAIGPYESHVIQELVPYIKNNFRASPSPSSWAVAGHSSGGYGAISLALRHPEVFGITISHSGDMGFEYVYLPDFPQAMLTLEKCGGIKEFMDKFYGLKKKDGASFVCLNTIAMAAAYSPNGVKVELPFNTKTGEILAPVWEKWLSKDPVRMVDQYQGNLKKLKIFVDCGVKDEYRLYAGSRMFSARLKEMGVSHTYEEFEDSHLKIAYRFDRSLGFVSEQAS